MKNYFNKMKSLVLVGAASMALASCGDFLYIEPKEFVSEENFWNERSDVEQMIAGAYNEMQSSGVMERLIIWGEGRSDNTNEGQNASDDKDIYRMLKEDLKPTNKYTDWQPLYKVICKCNIIIDRVDVVAEKDPTFTISDVKATKAEMSALRDLCYFYLVRAFKDVPYYTYAITSDEDVKPMPAVDGDKVVKSLIADLDTLANYALVAFPEDKDKSFNSSRNRITKSAIYALLADLCLWDGQYQRTVDYCQKIIDRKLVEFQEENVKATGSNAGRPVIFKHEDDQWSNGFPLYPCWIDQSSFGNEYNKIFGGEANSLESVFELAFAYDGKNSENEMPSIAGLYGSRLQGGNTQRGRLAVNTNLFKVEEKGKYYTHKNDVRYYENILPEDDEYSEAYIGKYILNEIKVERPAGKTNYSATSSKQADYNNRHWMFYRLTDVMLMQAEALIMLGQVTEETDADGKVTYTMDENLKRAFYLIWTVNRRSIMKDLKTSVSSEELKITKFSTKQELLDLCIQERNRELMFEGKRWFDLLRQCHREGNTNYIKARVSAKVSSGGSKGLFLNYESLYWPYNKEELIVNPELTQKPFYKGSDDSDENKLTY